MMKLLLVGLGGFAGAIARYGVQLLIPHSAGGFPWGTFVVNIVGSFLIGIIYALAEQHKMMTHEFRLILAVGFCGSFTTFSTFSADNLQLIQLGSFGQVTMNAVFSLVLGIVAVISGIYFTRFLI